MTEEKIGKLVRMANDIGDFYAVMPNNEAVDGAAAHLTRFWTPKMIRELVGFSEAGRSGLNPTAARAVEALKRAGRA